MPRTWVDGEIMTMAKMNLELRDLSVGLQQSWTDYSPTWTTTGTAPDIGGGTLGGSYIQIGHTVHFRLAFTVGAGTAFGTGQWRFTLPLQGVAGRQEFLCSVVQASTSSTWIGAANTVAGTQAYIVLPGTTAGGPGRPPSATVPFSWATNDQLYIRGTYETIGALVP